MPGPGVAGFGFDTPGRILFGRGCAAGAADLVTAFGASVVLVHGARADRASWLIEALRGQGGRVTAIACPGEPTLAALHAALGVARAAAPDVVVGLGGGSAIDMAKALAALVPGAGDPLDHLEVVGRGLPLVVRPLPMVAIPTTAGTGAEATRNAVIGVPDAGRKVSLRDPRMMPDLALVDPALMQGAPVSVALAAGLDAVTQVIEPYLCTRANPITDSLCRDAIARGLPALKAVVETGDPAAWDDMALTSLTGGIALSNAGLGAVHGLAGVIGGQTGAAHGAICGALLVPVLRANAAHVASGDPLGRRFDWVNDRITAVFGGLDEFVGWSRANGLPGLAALGVEAAMHPAIAEAALVSSSFRANPCALSVATLEAILHEAA